MKRLTSAFLFMHCAESAHRELNCRPRIVMGQFIYRPIKTENRDIIKIAGAENETVFPTEYLFPARCKAYPFLTCSFFIQLLVIIERMWNERKM